MDLFPGGYGLVFSLLFCFSTSSSLISGNFEFEVRPQAGFQHMEVQRIPYKPLIGGPKDYIPWNPGGFITVCF